MSLSTSLPVLLDLSKASVDQAAKELQSLVKSRTDASNQLETLLSYKRDYVSRMQQTGLDGVPASNYHNFRRFISTLDAAIAQQNSTIQQLESKFECLRSNWLGEKRRQNSYETLQERYRSLQQSIDNRTEQHRNDEASLNLYYRTRLQVNKHQP